MPLGLVAEPLVGQSLAWGLWGAAGGWLRPLRRAVAWPVAVALCFPLALATGFVLNAVGWAGETTVDAGGFLPGAGPWESLRRLVDYTAATSAALDLVRAVTNAAVVALIGMPVLGALRAAVGARPDRAVVVAPAPRVTEAALARRRRSDRLDHLWTPTEGEPE
ncbi:MAG: hypothetical protein GX596_08080 [Propionibacterium sp.]|nr:hypothetical protein [Propionibacterium sp.]